MRKSNDGFTLVELLVGILCAAIVTGAAMTLMLMGARTNRALLDANSEQSTARIITTMVETLASEGSIKTVVTVGDDGWALLDNDGATILNYSGNTVYSRGNVVLMENVSESSVALSAAGSTITGRLLDFSLTADEGTYKTSVFCRTADMGDKTIDGDKLEQENPDPIPEDDVSISMSTTEESGRFKFLEILCSQYGSKGQIKDSSTSFSQWYLGKLPPYGGTYEEYNNYHGLSGSMAWNQATPWCACFVSWGVDQISSYLNSSVYFAQVESGYSQFSDGSAGVLQPRDYTPSAGDLVFFNYDDINNSIYAPTSLDHVGVVFYCDSNYLYTIEGNTSIDPVSGIGRVDLKRYYLNDTTIKGYGVLDWKTDS